MIGLLYALLFNLQFITVLYILLAAFVVGRFDFPLFAHSVENGTLFFLHLSIDGKKSSSFLRCQTGVSSDELLLFCLKLLRREFPLCMMALVMLGISAEENGKE